MSDHDTLPHNTQLTGHTLHSPSATTQAVSDARLDELMSLLLQQPGGQRWHSEMVIALGELKAARVELEEQKKIARINSRVWREEVSYLKAELSASRQAVREAREWMQHVYSCDKSKPMPLVEGRVYSSPKDFDEWYAVQSCTCGLDAWLAAHPVEP